MNNNVLIRNCYSGGEYKVKYFNEDNGYRFYHIIIKNVSSSISH